MKSKKSALLLSFTSLLICFAMLVGSTFAWFTDTATTGVNKIQAGNLDVKLEYKKSGTETFDEADKNTKVFDENARWEPGHVEYVVLKVSNEGNLALKYKLGINIANEVGSTNVDGNAFKLSDHINFAVIDGDQSAKDRDDLVAAATNSKPIKTGYTSEETPLYPKVTPAVDNQPSEKTVTLVVWMPKDVGNEANHKANATAPSVELGINVVATQYTYEKDSKDDQYDEDATYLAPGEPVETEADLIKVIENGGEVSITKDIALSSTVQIAGDTVIHGNGKTITLNSESITNGALFDGNGHDLTIENLILDGQNGSIGHYFGVVNGGTDSTLTLSNVTIRNFKTERILRAHGVKNVSLTNVTISGNMAKDYGVLFTNVENMTLKKVSLTDNTVVSQNSKGESVGTLLMMWGNSAVNKLVAENITIENNTVGEHLIATSGTNCNDAIELTSGSIKGNSEGKGIYMVGSLMVGTEMSVQCPIVLNNDGNKGVCTLTNNGTIVGDISSADWAVNSRGKPIYTGTGTHTGTKTNLKVQ